MKISYAITVCTELEEIKQLLPFLFKHVRPADEIVVLYDRKNGSAEVREYLNLVAATNESDSTFLYAESEFTGNFSEWKNQLTALCTGSYIVNIDADEMPSEYMLRIMPQLLEHNNVDVIMVPRINTVTGLTDEHISKWRWNVNERGWVNFPDYQWRIYRNTSDIRWKNRVHETLDGYKTLSHLPRTEEWCLRHDKTIVKQEQQNKYYDTL